MVIFSSKTIDARLTAQNKLLRAEPIRLIRAGVSGLDRSRVIRVPNDARFGGVFRRSLLGSPNRVLRRWQNRSEWEEYARLVVIGTESADLGTRCANHSSRDAVFGNRA